MLLFQQRKQLKAHVYSPGVGPPVVKHEVALRATEGEGAEGEGKGLRTSVDLPGNG